MVREVPVAVAKVRTSGDELVCSVCKHDRSKRNCPQTRTSLASSNLGGQVHTSWFCRDDLLSDDRVLNGECPA